MKYKLLATDLDQTMVPRRGQLSERGKKAIEQMQKEGILFCIASGRPLSQITPLCDKWDIHPDIIMAYNGAELHYMKEGKEYNYFTLSEETMKEIITMMRPLNLNLNIVIGSVNYFSQPFDPVYINMLKDLGQTVEYKEEEFFYKALPKIMMRLDPSRMEEVEKFISEHPSDIYKGFKTGPMIVEFCDKRVSKGYALQEICRISNIDISQTIAMGDTSNDNELIEAAGLGVCMLNGSEDTKAIADVITEKDCLDDGWADFIEKHILNENN